MVTMDSFQEYAFIDESGNTACNIENKMLIIAGVVTDDITLLQRKMKKAEKKLLTNNRNREIKAFRQSPSNRSKIFLSLSDVNYSIYFVLSFSLLYKINLSIDFNLSRNISVTASPTSGRARSSGITI